MVEVTTVFFSPFPSKTPPTRDPWRCSLLHCCHGRQPWLTTSIYIIYICIYIWALSDRQSSAYSQIYLNVSSDTSGIVYNALCFFVGDPRFPSSSTFQNRYKNDVPIYLQSQRMGDLSSSPVARCTSSPNAQRPPTCHFYFLLPTSHLHSIR